jgi:ribosomal protein S18 acetylase RimI-like enzyme
MVQLIPMTDAEYAVYLERAVREYADGHVRGGRWTAGEALEKSAEEYRRLLPEGTATPDQHLFMIEDTALGEKVGLLWFAVQKQGDEPVIFVYDVHVDEQFRRRGYGEQAFQALETMARELGAHKISLHVFGYNHSARALYQKLGFVETNVMMSKQLDESENDS